MQQELKPYCACQCDEQAHKMGLCQHVCVPYPKNKMTELQLLVIDLGDECYVRVEKGSMPHTSTDPFKDKGFYGKSSVVKCSFDELRKAIDGEKPAIRLEDGYDEVGNFMLFTDKSWLVISSQQYDALSQLAGHPLPIYEGGKWTDLMPKNGVGWELPINVWRYTR